MTKILRNATFSEVNSNAAGIRSRSFLARKSDIKEFPKLPDTPVDGSANVVLDGDYVMQTDKTFIELYTRKGTGQISFEPTGPKDGIFFEEKAEIDYPDLDDDIIDLAKNVINDELILVAGIRVANTDKFTFVQLGSEMFPGSASPSGSTGTLDSPDDKGLKFEFTANSTTPLVRYTGIINTADGQWDCETGVFTATADLPAGGE